MQVLKRLAVPLTMCTLAGVTAVVGISAATSVQAAVSGGPVLALTADNTIVAFNAAAPGTLTQNTPITGLQPGETVVGFDVRPATGELFAVGVAGTSGRMYVINTSNGVATSVGSTPFSTTLPAGGTWSLDFNPAVDRIRFVHSSGVNLRLNPLNGGLAATDTTVAPAKPAALAYDRSISPAPSATTLFAIDDVTDTLNLIGGVNGTPSPNAGATTSVGALGVDVGTGSVGFDIAPQGDSLATFSVGGSYGLYTVNLTTGAASLIGAVGTGTTELRDIALPRPPVGPLVALQSGNLLLGLDAAAPGTTTSTAITGLQPSESIVGIDFRPATGELIGVGFVGTEGRVYRIDPSTGAATQIGSAAFNVTSTAPTWAVDFNPTVDRIRLTNSLGDSYRVNPVNGALVATDTDIAPAIASAVAYDRSTATTSATTLYAIDSNADTLNIIGGPDAMPSPNTGVTTARGPLGVDADLTGFDISQVGEAVATLRVGGNTGLYTISLVTGAAELIGTVGDGTPAVLDLAFPARFTAGASQFSPVAPTRLLDTRDGSKPAAGSTTDVTVAGVAGVPANATAVVLNLTGTEVAAPGFVTAFAAGDALPVASNLNLTPGESRANLATVQVGTGGMVSLYSLNSTHLVVDVLGYYAAPTGPGGRFSAMAPVRLIDTRESMPVGPASSVSIPVLGMGNVPAMGVSAVMVSIVGTNPNQPGFLTAYASGTPLPGTSNVNLNRAGATTSNLAIVPVGADGSISVYSLQVTDVVVDVIGWFGDASAKGGPRGLFVAVDPNRVLDTRIGVGAPSGPLAPEASIDLTLAGAGGVPAFGAAAAVFNVTVVQASRPGFVTVYPTGQPLTTVSSLNADTAGQIVPGLVGAAIGTGSRVTIYNHAGGHLVGDVAGWFTA